MLQTQPTKQAVSTPRAGAGTDIASIALAQLDLAFLLEESEANLIVGLNALPAQPLAFTAPSVTFSGTLTPTPMTGALSCGTVGGTVASGVIANLSLSGTATVNGNNYATPFTFAVLPNAFLLEEQATMSAPAQAQLSYLETTYGNIFQSCSWGLDYGELTFLAAPPMPDGWAAADWAAFSTALQTSLIATPIPNGQVTLMQGITPDPQSAQWNYGPTAWCCFNVPPYDDTCQPALVFGFMVSNHPMPSTPASDFQAVQLFTTTPPNALIIASSGIVIGEMVPQIMPFGALQSAAQFAVTVAQTDTPGSEQYNLLPNVMTAGSTTPASGWPVGYAGSTTQSNSDAGYHYNTQANATTTTQAGMTFSNPDNGLNQQLAVSGSYTINGSTSGNQYGWQFTVPQAIFSWSIAATIAVGSTGIVSFSVTPGSSDFPTSRRMTETRTIPGGWRRRGSPAISCPCLRCSAGGPPRPA